ncbi:MAG: right-handed parallel beta-helix repeat-containing protein, partial [Sedimentisphaerales bacterium]
NFKRSPVAIYSLGFSELTIDTCRFEGFEYTVCFGEGSKGTIQNCLVMDSGHQGITLYAGADVKVLGNVVTGSGYHGVRSTGGTLNMKDNLIINNKNRGVYLGNRSALGTIENNVIIGNGTGISGFAQSNVTIQRNVIADTGFAGIDMRDSCRLSIRDNIIKGNDRGLALFKESGTNTNKTYRNTFWQNKTETENISPSEDSITSDPLFNDAANGDFSLKPGPVLQAKQGLENPETFIKLWKKWKNRADKNEPFAETNANKKQDGLEFRIAPDSVEPSRNTSLLTPEQELKYKEDLRQNGPEAGWKRNDEYIWLLLRDELPSTFPITQEYRGRRYLLVCNRKPFIMLLDGSWDIKQIREVSDNMSMPAISLEFDQKVGEQFYQLTSSNIKRSLAIIFDGVVIAAPTIESATRSKVMITGSFTEDEIQTMIKALKDDISS